MTSTREPSLSLSTETASPTPTTSNSAVVEQASRGLSSGEMAGLIVAVLFVLVIVLGIVTLVTVLKYFAKRYRSRPLSTEKGLCNPQSATVSQVLPPYPEQEYGPHSPECLVPCDSPLTVPQIDPEDSSAYSSMTHTPTSSQYDLQHVNDVIETRELAAGKSNSMASLPSHPIFPKPQVNHATAQGMVVTGLFVHVPSILVHLVQPNT